jgi:hypothetical protein
MDLPRPLAPWGSYLSVFPRDVALSLGPVLQRLSSAVGPLGVRQSSGDGETDGFDGLARKGGYERLLASEWLLADEAPGEFTRRAAMGEHLFLRINHPAPGGSRASVAVFDAGPGQLGSPRIAQLAALIVLARRAETAGARFAWGILQEPAAPLFPAVSETGVFRLLQARTAHEATDAQVQAWRERVRGWRELDDLWLVGSQRLGAMPAARGASLLQLWDVLVPDTRQVAVKVRRGPGPPLGEVALELPGDDACARLLRDPFAAATMAASPRRLARSLRPVSNLLFAAGAAKLLARAAGGGVVCFPFPSSPRGQAGRPKRFDPGPGVPPVAAGAAGRKVVLVTEQDGVLRSWPFGKAAPRPSPSLPVSGRGEESEAHLQPVFLLGGSTFAVDAAGRLVRLLPAGLRGEPELLADRVLGAAVVARRLVFVEAPRADRPARVAVIADVAGTGAPSTALELAADVEGVFFGYGGRMAHPHCGLAAVAHAGGAWEVLSAARSRPFLTPFAGTRVVGVASDARRGEPGLLLLEEDRRSLVLAGLHWTRKLPSAGGEIAQVAASSTAPLIAYTTVNGGLVIASLDRGAPLLRLFPEEHP